MCRILCFAGILIFSTATFAKCRRKANEGAYAPNICVCICLHAFVHIYYAFTHLHYMHITYLVAHCHFYTDVRTHPRWSLTRLGVYILIMRCKCCEPQKQNRIYLAINSGLFVFIDYINSSVYIIKRPKTIV